MKNNKNNSHDFNHAQLMFFESIVDNVPDMIFVKDAKELRFVLFNKAGEKLLGYSKEDMIGKSDYDFFSKKQADFFISKDRDVLAKKILLDIPEEPIKTKYGERFLHTKKIPILDENGKPLYLLGISEDITERKNMRRKLDEYAQSLEKKVVVQTKELADKVGELESTNKFMVGRELKMVKLKKENEKLEEENENIREKLDQKK